MTQINSVSAWNTAVSTAIVETIQALLNFLPNLIGALLVFLIGVLVAKWSKTIIVKTLQAIQFEKLFKNSQFKKFLTKADVSHKIEELLGSIVKWIIILTFFIASANIIGLTSVSSLLTGVLNYIPNVLSAVIVLVLGVLLAGVVERLVKGSIAGIDIKIARLMGKISSYIIVVIAILAAFSELRIATGFINIIFIGLVSTLSLGMALAIGLGAKDIISELLSDWHTSLKKELKKK